MKKYPTIAVIEFASIADGIYCTDALLKKAPIAMIKSGDQGKTWTAPKVVQQMDSVTVTG